MRCSKSPYKIDRVTGVVLALQDCYLSKYTYQIIQKEKIYIKKRCLKSTVRGKDGAVFCTFAPASFRSYVFPHFPAGFLLDVRLVFFGAYKDSDSILSFLFHIPPSLLLLLHSKWLPPLERSPLPSRPLPLSTVSSRMSPSMTTRASTSSCSSTPSTSRKYSLRESFVFALHVFVHGCSSIQRLTSLHTRQHHHHQQ